MSSLFDCLPPGQRAALSGLKAANGLKPEDIRIGDVFRIRMDESNGIIPKDGLDFRPRFFIILGCAPDGTLYGGVVINKAVNPNIPEAKQKLHMEIQRKDYGFLTREKSYIDCSKVMQVSVATILTWEYLGAAPANDIPLIINSLTSPDNKFIRRAQLRALGIIS